MRITAVDTTQHAATAQGHLDPAGSEFTRCCTEILGVASLGDDLARFLLQFHNGDPYSLASAQNLRLDINLFLQKPCTPHIFQVHPLKFKYAIISQQLNFRNQGWLVVIHSIAGHAFPHSTTYRGNDIVKDGQNLELRCHELSKGIYPDTKYNDDSGNTRRNQKVVVHNGI